MKIASVRLAAVALVALAFSFVGSNRASADYVNVQIGTPPPMPPPPAYRDTAWARPSRGAVWIDPHYEVVRGRWVWQRGYYTYPPRPGMTWVPAHYFRGRWYPGRWRY